MTTIRDFMTEDHRRCDDVFAEVEQAVASGDWNAAAESFGRFHCGVLQHFTTEESLLFPTFEEKTGMYMGPTQVMRGEHVQMRELMAAAAESLAAKDADGYSGNAETLLIMMQQHNMKEENILYPMCDQHLAEESEALLPGLQASLAEAGK
ncbi:MAG: hemerythrin domain-containing protein [Betaproteobacteria bacterium]|uniref:Hemerythrin domain-containing protein n=1 Tax=Candidatus Proximibacter danicus TaxID=2954365 RepID=A0A9D7K364_9PROT|nr:hemerythrin domain-containing protein [Candidatus Proximibacter danicus]MBK9445665.1 hemerythrin domain-containing protein [Betaproteobacteria bacterium]